MRKLLVLVLAMMMVLAMVPTAAVAAGEKTIDVADVPAFYPGATYSTYSDGTAGLTIRYRDAGDLFENTILTNRNGNMCQITIWSGSETVTLQNLTTAPGIIFEMGGTDGARFVIKNCTFNGPAMDAGGDARYQLFIMGGYVTLENNVFNKVYRGLNFLPRTNTYSLTATGNIFDLEPVPGKPEDNVGIQLSGDGNPWPANSVYVSGNTFKNATLALRPHSSFKAAADVGDQTIAVFSNNTLINCGAAIGPHPSATGNTLATLLDIIAKNFVESNTMTGKDTVVTAGVDPTFTIVIPAAVNLGTLQKGVDVPPQTFEVEAKNVIIEEGKSIVVSVSSDFTLSTSGGATLGYELHNSTAKVGNNETFATFNGDRIERGSVSVPDTSGIAAAGVYQDTMTFTISYQ